MSASLASAKAETCAPSRSLSLMMSTSPGKNAFQGEHLVRGKRERELLGGWTGNGVQLNPRRSDAPGEGRDLLHLGGDSGHSCEQEDLQPDLSRKTLGESGDAVNHPFKGDISVRTVDVSKQALVSGVQRGKHEVGRHQGILDFAHPQKRTIGQDSHRDIRQTLILPIRSPMPAFSVGSPEPARLM